MSSTAEQTPQRFSIFISVDEWRNLVGWMHASRVPDERDPAGHFLLVLKGARRTWVTTDRSQLVTYSCDGPRPNGLDPGSPEIEVIVNSRFFRGLSPEDVVLEVEDSEGVRTLTLVGDGYRFSQLSHPGPFPDWRTALQSAHGHVVRVDVRNLLNACNATVMHPEGVTDMTPTAAWIAGVNGRLRMTAPWIEMPDGVIEVECHGPVPETVPALVSPRRLIELLSGVETSIVELTLPEDPRAPLGISAGDISAVLMPLDRWMAERGRLEELLADRLGDDSVTPDSDGDYAVPMSDGSVIWVRLNPEVSPTAVQVFSVIAQSVPATLPLLEEVNAINASSAFVKVILAADAVMAEVDLVAADLDRIELDTAINVVHRAGATYGSLLGSFFGEPTGDE